MLALLLLLLLVVEVEVGWVELVGFNSSNS
jgi:hypothetical protein